MSCRWPSVRTAQPWSRAAMTAPYGSGMWRQVRSRESRSTPNKGGSSPSVQPRRLDLGNRRRRRHDSLLGRRQSPADRRAPHRTHGATSIRWRSARMEVCSSRPEETALSGSGRSLRGSRSVIPSPPIRGRCSRWRSARMGRRWRPGEATARSASGMWWRSKSFLPRRTGASTAPTPSPTVLMAP